ncbi:hypothetical protein PtB15_9B482 [Puccinia triticina]|nr:hypothetical protein PtB15_9B482 [Puccinia triticina]
MGLNPSGYEKQQAQGSTVSQPDKLDLFSSTLSLSNPNQEGEFKCVFQASRLTLTSNSSDKLAPAAATAHLLRPGVSLARRPHHAPRHPHPARPLRWHPHGPLCPRPVAPGSLGKGLI